MKTTSYDKAWAIANKLLDRDVTHDEGASERAGYPVYTASVNEEGNYAQVSDLGTRLEVTNSEGHSTNVWIVESTAPVPKDKKSYIKVEQEDYIEERASFFDNADITGRKFETVVQADSNGVLVTTISEDGQEWFCEHYNAPEQVNFWWTGCPDIFSLYGGKGSQEYHNLARFMIDESFKYGDAWAQAWDRRKKTDKNVCLTWEEFQAEARQSLEENDRAKFTFSLLEGMHKSKKITASFFYRFASIDWTREFEPSLLQAYMMGNGDWKVNDCLDEISTAEAKCLVNEWYGFEVGRIQIIGTPCYNATDWHFIRFNVRNMQWLMMNDELYQVYD